MEKVLRYASVDGVKQLAKNYHATYIKTGSVKPVFHAIGGLASIGYLLELPHLRAKKTGGHH